jgi:hypothetical protein
VKKMMNNNIEATILNGKFKGEDVLLPRILMILIDMLFEFKRLQFPVRLAFAMTINKAQAQSLQVCGLNFDDLFMYTPEGKTKIFYIKKLFNKHNKIEITNFI